MLHVALWEPEIPPNTGNVARLCAATGAALHLIGRLGFHLDDRSLKRAGLDYWHAVDWRHHLTLEDFEAARTGPAFSGRLLCFGAHAQRSYTRAAYLDGDCLLFGSESSGLPQRLLHPPVEHTYTIPMPAGQVRCLNLATAVGIVLYEALRQLHAW